MGGVTGIITKPVEGRYILDPQAGISLMLFLEIGMYTNCL